MDSETDADDFPSSSDEETELCIHANITVTITDYISKPHRVDTVTDIDPSSHAESLLDALALLRERESVKGVLQRKDHFCFLHVDKGKRTVLKKRDTLAKLKLQKCNLYYVNINRIMIGRDYWAPSSPDTAYIHYRGAKAYVKQVIGGELGLQEKERVRLFTLYAKIADLLRPRIHIKGDKSRIGHRMHIDYLKATVSGRDPTTWRVRIQHMNICEEVARELCDKNSPHAKQHPIITRIGPKGVRELVKWQYLSPSFYLVEKRKNDGTKGAKRKKSAKKSEAAGVKKTKRTTTK